MTKDEPRIEFKVKEEDGTLTELLRLDKQGFLYKGQYIKDGGEAHDAFVDAMNRIKKAKSYMIDSFTIFAFAFAAGYALCYWGLQ